MLPCKIHLQLVKYSNEIRETGEAFDSFFPFATLHKEPLYFF